jgi:hypothetical protein
MGNNLAKSQMADNEISHVLELADLLQAERHKNDAAPLTCLSNALTG